MFVVILPTNDTKMAKKKWYVVWNGVETGVYDNWIDCKRQVDGFEKPLYKSFDSPQEAHEAYDKGPWEYIGGKKEQLRKAPQNIAIIRRSLSVDAACSGNPGLMEYRGVYTDTGEEIFRSPAFPEGTNNIGEFLALVHGLALLQKQNLDMPIYSDSVNAIKWVQAKKCKTKLARTAVNEPIFNLIERAEHWLKTHHYTTEILKWDTRSWGEIPADFGRK